MAGYERLTVQSDFLVGVVPHTNAFRALSCSALGSAGATGFGGALGVVATSVLGWGLGCGWDLLSGLLSGLG